MAKVKTLDLNEFGKTRSTGFGLLEFDNSGYATVPSGKEAEFKRLCDISPTLQWVEEEPHSLEKVQGGLTSDAVDKNIQSTSQEKGDENIQSTSQEKDDKNVQSLSQEEIDEMNQKEHENPGYVEEDEETEEDEKIRKSLPANVEGTKEFNEANQEATEESTLTEEERQALREVLQTKTIDELRQVCREADISEDEIKSFKGVVGKIDLIEFIIKKNII